MGFLKTALFVTGCLAGLLGLLWVGQGTGYFPYPRNSFMINETPWIYRGTAVLLTGVIVAALFRPRPRTR